MKARHDDMRAFIEEAAGISLYKERRRETETRMAETRENLARLQDLRDEVDSQIRHLQRQARVARRYQDCKTQERTLSAELLALRLRELDSGAQVQDGAVRGCELAMQQALADQRAAEAGVERQRSSHSELGEALAGVQGRYYELGAEVTRAQESIRYGRERRESARSDLTKADASLCVRSTASGSSAISSARTASSCCWSFTICPASAVRPASTLVRSLRALSRRSRP